MPVGKTSPIQHGVALFNESSYFEAHEALEDAWRESAGEERRFLQGLVQAAVAMHHLSAGNFVGARGVMKRALRNLEPYPTVYREIEVQRLREELRDILTEAERQHRSATKPKMRVAKTFD
jgi:predicted metal-dependent hydrolase